jgi:hypothetical protein
MSQIAVIAGAASFQSFAIRRLVRAPFTATKRTGSRFLFIPSAAVRRSRGRRNRSRAWQVEFVVFRVELGNGFGYGFNRIILKRFCRLYD